MNDAFQLKLHSKLAAFRDWAASHDCSAYRLVQYCGVDFVFAIDISSDSVVQRIESLICEGFYVDWVENEGRHYLRVWEYGGPEPDWSKVFKEESLD